MPFSQTNIGRVRLGKQTAWNNATPSPAFSDIHVVEAEVFLPELSTEVLSTEALRGNYAAYRTVDGGKSNIPISIRMPMHGWSSTSPGSDPTSSNQHVDALILEYALGAASYVAGVGSATHSSAGNTTTTTYASGDAISEGKAVLIPISATPTYSIGWAKDVSGDDCTWISPLSSAAHASTTCKGALLQHMSTARPTTGCHKCRLRLAITAPGSWSTELQTQTCSRASLTSRWTTSLCSDTALLRASVSTSSRTGM